MFCVKCGTQLPDDASFCLKCGAPQRTDGQAVQANQPERVYGSFRNRDGGTLTITNKKVVHLGSGEDFRIEIKMENVPSVTSKKELLISPNVGIDSKFGESITFWTINWEEGTSS